MGTEKASTVRPTSYRQQGQDVFTITSINQEDQIQKDPSTCKQGENMSNHGCLKYFRDTAMGIKSSLSDTKIVVHILVCTFAFASWADLNGMWAELPLLVIEAEEKWTLPSYITIISQVANIGPLLFVLTSYLFPRTKPKLEKVTSFVIILVSMAALFLLAFFWQETSEIGGMQRSTALLTLNFFLAVGDCTSSVSFYAFMSLMKPQYMASLFIGEGFSGLLPAMIALGQGAGDIVCVNSSQQVNETYPNGTEYNKTIYFEYPKFEEPHFTVKVYFIILSALMACSVIAFVLLNTWSYCKSEMVDPNFEAIIQKKPNQSYGAFEGREDVLYKSEPSTKQSKQSKTKYTLDNGHDGPYIEEDNTGVKNYRRNEVDPKKSTEVWDSESSDISSLDRSLTASISVLIKIPHSFLWEFFSLLGIIVVVNMTLTTFLATIQIYSVLPYGLEYYHLTTTLTQIANPVACFFALFVMAENFLTIAVITLLGEVCVGYIVYLAAMSPRPPMHDKHWGGDLVVTIWILLVLFLVYAKVCVAGILRKHGRSALVWGGVATQVGSLIGALVGFVLVNVFEVFQDAPYC